MSSEAGAQLSPRAVALVEAVLGVLGPRQGGHPLHEPSLGEAEASLVAECVRSGWVSSVGAHVDGFEAELAARCGREHAVATSTGTAALHVALLLAGVEPGDEVLCPSLTFVATANAVRYCNATPHFVEAEERTLGVDPGALARHLAEAAVVGSDGELRSRASGARIRALVVTHIFGAPAEAAALAALCASVGIALVEDAAEALGSEMDGEPVGGHGVAAALSFNGNKVITTGGGGAVLTDDADLARRAKHLTTTARQPAGHEFVHDEVGFNYRLPNLNAALGRAQLGRLDEMLAAKRAHSEAYARAVQGLDGARMLLDRPGARSNRWLDAIVLAEDLADERDAVLDALHAGGAYARPLWAPMHLLPMYSGCPRADLPVTEAMHRRVVSLPSSAYLGAATEEPER